MKFNISPDIKIKPRKGKVLLAEPFLDDPYFKRTVILLCEHNEEGSFGFVLNNYIDIELDQVMDELPTFSTRISIGGPVNNSNLYYLHTLGEQIGDSVEVMDGIYMGGDFDILKKKLRMGQVQKDEVRFFVGYSGWSPNQLDTELGSKSWFVANVKPKLLMNTDVTDLWKKVMESMGSKGSMIANLPDDPSLN
jgi:putative transcriptional regulator